MTTRYTVMINNAEYGDRIFDTREEAVAHRVKLILEDEPSLKGLPDEEILDYDEDGYYRILDIHNVADEGFVLSIDDKYRIKDNLVVGAKYGGVTFRETMNNYKDMDLTIDTITSEHGFTDFTFQEDPWRFSFTLDMLEKVGD